MTTEKVRSIALRHTSMMMSERTQCDQCEWDVTAKRGRGWFQTAWGRNYCPDCGTIIKEQRPRYEFEGYSNERI